MEIKESAEVGYTIKLSLTEFYALRFFADTWSNLPADYEYEGNMSLRNREANIGISLLRLVANCIGELEVV